MQGLKDRHNLYLALIHFPVYNKDGQVVTTSVTNLDLHDLARTGFTYGVRRVFIVTPSVAQQKMVRYIKDYWHNGFGAAYNPDRKEAFGVLDVVSDVKEACLTIQRLSGKNPLLVATTAKRIEKSVGYQSLRARLVASEPVLIGFGTGFGLTREFLEEADVVLEPVVGAGSYNHLPVRSAVAIILDRLVSRSTNDQ